jgi:hypothetical protein
MGYRRQWMLKHLAGMVGFDQGQARSGSLNQSQKSGVASPATTPDAILLPHLRPCTTADRPISLMADHSRTEAAVDALSTIPRGVGAPPVRGKGAGSRPSEMI